MRFFKEGEGSTEGRKKIIEMDGRDNLQQVINWTKKWIVNIENRDILEAAISLRRKLHFPCKHGKAVVN